MEISMVTGLGCEVKYSGFKAEDIFLTPVPNFNVWLHAASIPDQAVTVQNHVELLWKLRHYAYYLKPHQKNPKTTRA